MSPLSSFFFRVTIAVAALVLVLANAAPSISFDVKNDGSYTLSSPDWPNLSLSSAPTGVMIEGTFFSSGDGSLVISSPASTWTGSDSVGPFAGTTFGWGVKTSPTVTVMTTTFKQYTAVSAVGFAATFPAGITTGSIGVKAKDNVEAAFPSWSIPSSPSPLGFLQWDGPFINEGLLGPRTGSWDATGATNFSAGLSSGPIVLLDTSASASLLLSAASEYMAVSAAVTGNALSFGPLGSVDSLPIGYSYECIAYLGVGVNYNIMSWGQTLLSKAGKPHGLSKSDFTNTHLIYNTDHGAFYYYNTDVYQNYSQVLDAVGEYAASVGIPYRGVLLDSWWYFQNPHSGGVKNWTARPTIFTGGNAGIRDLVKKFDWKVTAHNRYWSVDTDYAIQNGGNYSFFIDANATGAMAVPLETAFWTHLLTNAVTEWGLSTYEQDWLFNELNGVTALLTDVTLGSQWLRQMGTGAANAGVSIQLCMAYPRHALQSMEMPTVTQIRASDDHVPGELL